MIRLHKNPIDYYIGRLKRGKRFALAGYSDAEWFSILRRQLGKRTGLGQVLDGATGDKLLEVLRTRQSNTDFLFSVPECIWTDEGFVDARIGETIEAVLFNYGIQMEFFERDGVTDSLAESAGLYPFIKQLQAMDVVIIGNRSLRGLEFLGYKHFVEIVSPNLHMEDGGIENAVDDARAYGQPAVYLVSAGMSAALILDRLHDAVPGSFFIDCGSIWDAFVGIGGQRPWRKELYDNPLKLERWKHDNLYGKNESRNRSR